MARLAEIDTRIGEIDKQLAKDFPDYAALVSPKPLIRRPRFNRNFATTKRSFCFSTRPKLEPTPEETFIWVVTKTDSRWVTSRPRHEGARARRRGTALRARLRRQLGRTGFALRGAAQDHAIQRPTMRAASRCPSTSTVRMSCTRRCSVRSKT